MQDSQDKFQILIQQHMQQLLDIFGNRFEEWLGFMKKVDNAYKLRPRFPGFSNTFITIELQNFGKAIICLPHGSANMTIEFLIMNIMRMHPQFIHTIFTMIEYIAEHAGLRFYLQYIHEENGFCNQLCDKNLGFLYRLREISDYWHTLCPMPIPQRLLSMPFMSYSRLPVSYSRLPVCTFIRITKKRRQKLLCLSGHFLVLMKRMFANMERHILRKMNVVIRKVFGNELYQQLLK
jgi:hypothetical protein